MENKIYGYIRVSTLGQNDDRQWIAMENFGVPRECVYADKQSGKDFDRPAYNELMKLVLEEKIAHGGHPVLRWNMDNIFIRTDPAGNIKAKSTEKIDGAIALIMALDRAIRCGNDSGESVYDSRGVLVI